jgi:chloride channel protein, CIC family
VGGVTAIPTGSPSGRPPRRIVRDGIAWLHGSPTGLVGLALVVGVGAGLGAIAFRELILLFTRALTGRDDYSAAGRAGSPHFPGLGMWFVVLAPVIVGLVYGPLVDRFAREARGHGVPEVMLAVAEKGGRIRPQVAVVKSLASALCIGGGGSVGREGPIVQIGSALGSTLGQLVRLPESRLRILVACGAAGGISATFNAPIAGVFFALELILQDFAAESFGVVVLSSIVAAAIGRAAFGSQSFLALPTFQLVSNWEFLLYAGLGVTAAVVGVVFIRVLYGAEDLCDRLWRGPEWLRPAVGGVLLGLLLLALPEMYGVGYPVLENAIRGQYVLWFLAILLGGKIAATSLTIGIGGSGGVFAPSLFMGAMLGSGFGQVMHQLAPGIAGSAGAYGLIGMGAVFAAAARAPITAVIIIFELTGEYTVILPLMFAVVLSTSLSAAISPDTIYTLKLRRRGIDIRRGRAANLMEVLQVRDAMRPLPAAVPARAPLTELIHRLTEDREDALPVVDESGAFRGTLLAREVEAAARDNSLDAVAADLAREAPAVSVDETLHDALGRLARTESGGLPVVDAPGGTLVGWITHRDVLLAYARRLERSVDEAQRRAAAPEEVTTAAGQQARLPVGAALQGYRVVDLELGADAHLVGRRIADVRWPRSSLVVAVRRGDAVQVPGGDTVLLRGDRLSVLVPAGEADALVDIVSGSRDGATEAGPTHPEGTSGAGS